MDTKISVLLVEDEKLVAEAIGALLSLEPRITVVAQAETGAAAIRKARLMQPDVILLDLHLPDQPVVEVVETIKRGNPKTRIVILTAFAEDQEVAAVFHAGVIGYVLKTEAIDDLVKAVENAHQGLCRIPPKIARTMMLTIQPKCKRYAEANPLSKTELTVLSFVAQGLQNKEIAALLGISRLTVQGYLTRIFSKLNLTNRTQAAIYAYQKGLTD